VLREILRASTSGALLEIQHYAGILAAPLFHVKHLVSEAGKQRVSHTEPQRARRDAVDITIICY